MPSLLIDDGNLEVARQRVPTRTNFPFVNLPVPDVFARFLTRGMVIRPQYFQPITIRRTSWRNVLIFSNNFDDGTWNKTRSSVTRPGELAPDNSLAWRLTEDTTPGASHLLDQGGIALVAPGTVARYIIAKADTRSRIELATIGDVSVAQGFDLIEGVLFPNTLGMTDPERRGMINLGDGWWFCWLTQSFLTGLSAQTLLNDGTSATYDGDGTSGLFLAYDHVIISSTRPGPIFHTDAEARTINAPEIDTGDASHDYDPFGFLIEETEPTTDNVGRYIWDRVFGRIPGRQSVPSPLTIQKPSIPGSGDFPRVVGDYFVRTTFLDNIFDAYFRYQVAADSGVPSFYPTGGTYTLTFDGDTTSSLAFDATASDVETALNALASITARGGVTVAGAYNDPLGFEVSFADYAAAETFINGGSLTPNTGIFLNTGGGTDFGHFQFIWGYNAAGPITAGTFTVTFFGIDTTASINWNDDEATVAAAINAISYFSDRGGVTVSFPNGQLAAVTPMYPGGPYQFGFNMIFNEPAITAANSLTPAGSAITIVNNDPPYGAVQQVKFSSGAQTRLISIPSHNIQTGQECFIPVPAQPGYVIAGSRVNRVDDNTIALTVLPTDADALFAPIIEFDPLTKRGYRPGSASIASQRITDFYLPGVTIGIATQSDIPFPPSESDTDTFLQRAFSGSGEINWQVGELAQWRGPILSLTKTTIRASDV